MLVYTRSVSTSVFHGQSEVFVQEGSQFQNLIRMLILPEGQKSCTEVVSRSGLMGTQINLFFFFRYWILICREL